MKWTSKQIEKYKRQKYISFLEKITKNLFKMFRNKDVTQDEFLKRFDTLKEKLDNLPKVTLNSNYHKEMQNYIDNLYRESKESFDLNSVREINMTNLNRIQKLKNRTSYRRDKHKNNIDREIWN
jgi:predicted RND superfamily exporter protein